MRALLDVNVLIALFDPAHIHHQTAHLWFGANRQQGWASCPITQNGCVRILAQPKYPNAVSFVEAVRRLKHAIAQPEHQFWSDSVSITDAQIFDDGRILNHRQLTDIYLLALATQNGGCLVTFDNAVLLNAVIKASKSNLVVL